MKEITLGGGCFWCLEAVFQRLDGVSKVESGYMDGHVPNPTYREVCNGTTGHAEVVRITFDEQIISLEEILEIFWATHNPTTLNRQGNDIGTQYRSGVYYYDENQKAIAEKSIKEMASLYWDDPIVTELKPATEFYIAEDYHQNYFNENNNAGYCRVIINPKVSKLRKHFANKLKN